MKRLTPVDKIDIPFTWIVVAIIVLIPFHAFLTVWLSSLVGHYTLLRLWKEFLLVPLCIGAIYILIKDRSIRSGMLSSWLTRLIFLYILLVVVCAAVAGASQAVSLKAVWYGLLVDLRFLVFFLVLLSLGTKLDRPELKWRRVVIGPAVLVAAFAILQYLVLPTDFLRHFGYGDSTISPYETINHNLHNLRVASTMRGANPLGAYLILPISTLFIEFFQSKRNKQVIAILFLGVVLALIFSFSRSAWIGALVAILAAAWAGIRSLALKRKLIKIAAGLVVIAVIIALALHNNPTFQNILLHSDRTPSATTSSDYGHSIAFKSAVKDIVHQPFGDGIGTAGPQSIYNDHPARIAENYYLQIGQETGIIGLVLFMAICIVLAMELYLQRDDSLALMLFASLIGVSVVNLLSHAWADDTLAYIWWGLAGICLAPAIIKDKHRQNNGAKKQNQPQTRRPIR